ncbi:hypothetical protein ATANTOWER_031417 [Ataeniobius toweri]|uniref:Uncharacterized protein n=1 Tax=Ataeniobius toweri TaxID=208326 RepID=A0ABU7B0B0_9TELE|nr:hypothetical protein [Ataeniobius toweri]
MKDSCNLNLCSFLKVPPWVLPAVPAQPDSVNLLSSPFGSQADCHRLLDAQPPKPVRPPTNCLPVDKHRPVHPKTELPSRTPNPPATRTNRWRSPELITQVIVSSKINILNFFGLLKVSSCGSKSLVKR